MLIAPSLPLSIPHSPLLKQRAGVERAGVELFFDAEELVVLGHAVAAAGGAGFDLAGAEADGEVGDGAVFGLAAAVAGNAGVAVAVSQVNGGDRLGERADLVDRKSTRLNSSH